MPAASITALLDEFGAELADAQDALTFATTASSIRPRLGAMLNWAAMDASSGELARRFMGLRESPLPGIARGLYINVAASYENFVRRLVRAGAELVAGKAHAFDDLEETLKHHNIYWTGRVFENVFRGRPHIKLDHYRLSADIGTCIPGSQKFRINAEAFAIDVTTPTAEALDRILQRIGVAEYWDDIGRDKGVQRSLGAEGVREAHRLAKEFLNSFVERRNLIVHVGGGASAIVESDVREAIDFFRTFALALGGVVSLKTAGIA